MARKKDNLWLIPFTVLITTTVTAASASEFLKSYNTDFNRNSDVSPVYKFVDANGRTTYSSFIQHDFADVEEIFIASPPPDQYVNETRLRSKKLKAVADELAQAREKREKNRQEKEKQRLERLALINQSKLRSYQRNRYGDYPFLYWGGYSHGGHWPKKPVHLPATPHRPSVLPASSSFLPGLH